MKPTPAQNSKSPFLFSCFCSPFSFFDQYFNIKIYLEQNRKDTQFHWDNPYVTILTMLEAIRTSQDGMSDEVSGNIIAELRKRGTFGGFSEDRMHYFLEGMWNKVEYNIKDSQKLVGQLEECSSPKGNFFVEWKEF